MSITPIQEHALALIDRGFIIQPAHRPDHESGGKQPIAAGWQNAEHMDAAGALALWAGDNPPNISVLTGARPGYFVIDVDGPQGNESMRDLLTKNGSLPETYMVKTPSGGWHLYFRQPYDVHIPTNKSRLAPGIDLRGDGGQVIGPGSRARTKSGELGTYDVVKHAKVAEAPQWLLDACIATATMKAAPQHIDNSLEFTSMSADMQEAARSYVQRAVGGITEELLATKDWPEGHSDDYGRGWEKTQADAALRLASFAITSWAPISMEDAHAAFLTAAPTDSGWTERDVEKKWASQVPRATPVAMPATLGKRGSIFSDPPAQAPAEGAKKWTKHSWDDIGNAERLYAYADDRLRWVPDLTKWARYERGAWHIEKDAGERVAVEMLSQVKDLEAGLYDTVKNAEGKSQRDKFVSWVKTQRYATKAQAAARTLRYTGKLNATTRDFDTQPMLLNVANGVVDLTTGNLLGHDPNYLFRQQSSASYNPEAKAPMWQKFLDRMMPDPDMQAYLQRVVGYTLTGRTDEQVFFMHHGVTKNGKSLFLDVAEAALGSYSQTVPPQTLLAKRQEQHPADVARMEGRRMLQLSETAQGARLDEALVKRLSGGDTVTARGMGEEFREFRMMGKVHLVTNHLPHINHDEATMRRLRLIHWGVTLPEEERDPTLAAKIIATELSGVLAWAVEGCLEWQRQGLNPPSVAVIDTEEYVMREDQLGEWINSRLRVNPNTRSTNEQIYSSYTLWCDFMRIKPMSNTALGLELTKRGFEKWNSNSRRGYYVDIILPDANVPGVFQ